jgi:hypothetical protein
VIRGLPDDVAEDNIDISPPPIQIYVEEMKKKVTQQNASGGVRRTMNWRK